MKHFLLFCATLAGCTLCASSHELLRKQLAPYLQPSVWTQKDAPIPTRKDLRHSLEAARTYYLAQQKKDGNFTYAMDIATGETADDDNQVRQAGALWGLVTLQRDFPTDQTRQAIVRGLDFVTRNTRRLKTGETVFVYPGEETIKTGTISLLCLAIMDFMEEGKISEDLRQHYRRLLFSYLSYLKTMELANGSWAKAYVIGIGFRDPEPSAYYDGETLLAYTIAAQKLHRNDLKRRIADALPALIRRYTLDAWSLDGDDDDTKGFYQWGSMACHQMVLARWQDCRQLARDAAIALAWWQLFQNQTESKRGNMAYALEGLIAAYHTAVLSGKKQEADIMAPPIRRIMGKLMICQFQGPFMTLNPKFTSLKNPAQSAIGGITEHKNSTVVRIDIVQHQVHAMLLMLKYMP